MPSTITVKKNQSMLDVIIQATGSLEAGMQFCKDNGVSLTSVPVAGSVLVVSDKALALGDTGVLQYLGQNKVVVANMAVVTEAPGALKNDDGSDLKNDDGSTLLS